MAFVAWTWFFVDMNLVFCRQTYGFPPVHRTALGFFTKKPQMKMSRKPHSKSNKKSLGERGGSPRNGHITRCISSAETPIVEEKFV
jgi:hypothetical protein